MKLMIIGNSGGTNVGSSFERAGKLYGHKVRVVSPSFKKPLSKLINSINWHFRGRLPAYLKNIDKKIEHEIYAYKPHVIITVGISPPGERVVSLIKSMNIKLINYLTDDPWQIGYTSKWFLETLPYYDYVFCTKTNLMIDINKLCPNKGVFLKFGFDSLFYGANPRFNKKNVVAHQIFFAGGGDSDRVPIIKSLVNSGFNVKLNGSSWKKDPDIISCFNGHATPEQLAISTFNADISLILVRRANRDGHVMRSFEAAASAACMLVEDTMEHREIFGGDGECVVFFNCNEQMISRARWLLDHPEERVRLRHAVYRRIVLEGKNTYSDRLRTILETVGVKV